MFKWTEVLHFLAQFLLWNICRNILWSLSCKVIFFSSNTRPKLYFIHYFDVKPFGGKKLSWIVVMTSKNLSVCQSCHDGLCFWLHSHSSALTTFHSEVVELCPVTSGKIHYYQFRPIFGSIENSSTVSFFSFSCIVRHLSCRPIPPERLFKASTDSTKPKNSTNKSTCPSTS